MNNIRLIRSDDYTGPERRKEIHLSDEQINTIAEKAANSAVQKLTDTAYKAIGKSVLEKLFYIVGVVFAAVYFGIQVKGKL